MRSPACVSRGIFFFFPTKFDPSAHTVYAAISSLSLSLLATGIDSVFDIGSNILLIWLHKKADRMDMNKWPVGGARLETIGNIVYGKSRLSPLSHVE